MASSDIEFAIFVFFALDSVVVVVVVVDVAAFVASVASAASIGAGARTGTVGVRIAFFATVYVVFLLDKSVEDDETNGRFHWVFILVLVAHNDDDAFDTKKDLKDVDKDKGEVEDEGKK